MLLLALSVPAKSLYKSVPDQNVCQAGKSSHLNLAYPAMFALGHPHCLPVIIDHFSMVESETKRWKEAYKQSLTSHIVFASSGITLENNYG